MKFTLAAFADEAGGSITEQIRAMKDNGVSMLEIRNVDGRNIADISAGKAREVRKRLADNGLGVWSLGSPYGKIDIHDDIPAHIEQFKHGLELADLLGARHVRLFSFFVPEDSADVYTGQVLEGLGGFLDAAKNSDVVLCHENEKGIYGNIAVRCRLIHENFPKLKAVFDPANFVQCGQEIRSAWALLSEYVEYMHIKDALPDGSVVPAGEGIGELPYLLENYQGTVLTVEPHLSVFEGFDKLEGDQKTKMKYCYPSPAAAFRAAVDALKGLLEG